MSAPAFGVTDILGLGAGWEPQSTGDATSRARATATGNDGDVVAQTGYQATLNITASYIYTGAETAFLAALTAASAHVGMYVNTLCVITGITIDYAPCAAGKRPLITFTGRNGPTADGQVYLPSITLPTNPGEVPDLLTNGDADSECQSAQYSLTAQFGEDLDKDGAFLAGDTYGAEESLSLVFVGKPTLTTTNWIVTAEPSTGPTSGSNTGYGTNSYTAVKGVLQTTTTT